MANVRTTCSRMDNSMIPLTRLNQFPLELYQETASTLHTVLPNPTMIHLQGESSKTVFVATLMHGNEHTGFEAVKKFLKPYLFDGKKLKKSMMLFLANPQAAKENVRHLKGQKDYNRVWNRADSDEAKLMQTVIRIAKEQDLFANIDIHNNTGKNPHYSCVSKIDHRFLYLAQLFSRNMVYFTSPDSVQSLVFSDFVPSVTLEAGLSGAMSGIDHVAEFLDAVFHVATLDGHHLHGQDFNIYKTMVRILVDKNTSFSFAGENIDTDIVFRNDLESLNFTELEDRFYLGDYKTDSIPLTVLNNEQEDVTHDYLIFEGGKIYFKNPTIPSMFTGNKDVILKDCLGYLMETVELVTP